MSDELINKSNAIQLIFAETNDEAKKLAKQDIENGNLFLFIQSGIAPVVYSTDSIFENTYKVHYYEQGCTGPDYELMKEYNHMVFDYFFQIYEMEWKKTIRNDVIGLKNWKQDR
jgi:hypothetical protein